jgi:carboxylate-amine ligase
MEESKNIAVPINKCTPIRKNKYALFEVAGIELEYMIVDRKTLSVKPICDKLMHKVAGSVVSSYDNGLIMWSNEIVNHVIELKTNGPVKNIADVASAFHDNVLQINALLDPFDAVLMSAGAHPWMNPITETQLWEHESNEVYSLYNKVFGCHSHGWSNLQSTHLNLPFANDEEFAQLHAAVRVLLPILPALCASSPILDGQITGYCDSRLEHYRINQQRVPSITGKIIPEAAYSESAYNQMIFKPMMAEVAPFDPHKILDCQFLNSRGAIARFDRGAIEIRILDIQECPMADLAIAEAIIAILKWMIQMVPPPYIQNFHEDGLAEIFLDCVKLGEKAVINDHKYIEIWGVAENSITAEQLWKVLQQKTEGHIHPDFDIVFKQIVESGTLSNRIIKYLENDYSLEKIIEAYGQMVVCLQENKLFNC